VVVHKLIVVLFCLLPLAGCSPKPLARDGVIHLDPRLADGSSSAQTLQSAQVSWIERVEVVDSSSELTPWSALYCQIDPVADGGPGIALRGNVPDETRFRRVELRSSAVYNADEVDFIELDLGRTTSGIVRVSWRSSLDIVPSAFPRATTALIAARHAPESVRIPLSVLPGWAGEISALTIAPKEQGQQRFDLAAIRLGRTGFSFAPDALGGGGDGGLVAMGREARRAWPSDWNVPLYAELTVPLGGRLNVAAGVSTNTTDLSAEVRFAVDAREAQDHAWKRVGGVAIIPGTRAQGPAWEVISAPLKAFEGKKIQLRFLAAAGVEPRDDGALERARVFWGEPLVTSTAPKDHRPNVLLITIDTLRADALGVMRGEQFTSPTPFIDQLARRGILFEQAWTACNSTSPSHASIMTGLAVQDHGLRDNRSVLAPSNTTVAEAFRAAGWHTAGAVSVEHLTPSRSGLGQGFDRFLRGQMAASIDGATTIDAVKVWLREFARSGERPTFLWVHLFDPHTPYDVPPAFLNDFARRMGLPIPNKVAIPASLPATPWNEKGQFLEGVNNREWVEFMYEACVAYSDFLVSELCAELEHHGVLDNTFIALTADHGEALGEHDNYYHHTGLFQEVMHVPLILVQPKALQPHAQKGLRIPEPVWSLDIAPTLFGIAGTKVLPEMRGTDLLEFVAHSERQKRRLYFEHSDLHQIGCNDQEFSAILSVVDYEQLGPLRVVPAGTLQLFDARSDWRQERELNDGNPSASAKYRELLKLWREGALDRETLKGELDEVDEARLQQLGY
jgi:arylsulfatase A-like enzyme